MTKLPAFLFLLSSAAWWILSPLSAHAATADLSITQSGIMFSTSTFYAGETIRIYAHVTNVGETDMTAMVSFYQGSTLIAKSQPISSAANGAPEEVFVDFTVPSGSFNIRALIQGAEPADENSSNNEATTPLYTAIDDADRDGVEDGEDNCPDEANADQADADGDRAGDACDGDDDGDGLSDARESTAGTNPLHRDTDGDGYADPDDPSPLTPEATEEEEAAAASAVAVHATDTADDAVSSSTGESGGEAQDAQDEAASAVAAPTTAYGVLNTSPRAHFSYIRNDWNSFAFSVQSPQDGMTYAWDFGDGSSSAQHDVVHDYDGPGVYTVTLTSRDADGNEDHDLEEVAVTFWNLENPWVQALLGFFAVLLLSLGVLLLAVRRTGVPDGDV